MLGRTQLTDDEKVERSQRFEKKVNTITKFVYGAGAIFAIVYYASKAGTRDALTADREAFYAKQAKDELRLNNMA